MDWNPVVSALAVLTGVGLGAWLTTRSEEKRRRLAFNERQLRELYVPLLACRREIEVLSTVRVKFQHAADQAWRSLVGGHTPAGVEAVRELRKERFPEFGNIIQYDNKQFADTVLPLYKKMRELFRENRWLAFAATLEYWAVLVEFIEQWDRHLAGSISHEVHELVGFREANLRAFYDHLAEMRGALHQALLRGKPCAGPARYGS